jgi:hypothetical protein
MIFMSFQMTDEVYDQFARTIFINFIAVVEYLQLILNLQSAETQKMHQMFPVQSKKSSKNLRVNFIPVGSQKASWVSKIFIVFSENWDKKSKTPSNVSLSQHLYFIDFQLLGMIINIYKKSLYNSNLILWLNSSFSFFLVL